MKDITSKFSELVSMVRMLRAEGGCPWDKAQTLDSICDKIIEEAHETKEAIHAKDYPNLKEELGDVLLNVLLQANIAEDTGLFTLDEVLTGVCEKVVRRHPHVFGNEVLKTPEEVLARWKEIKASEKITPRRD